MDNNLLNKLNSSVVAKTGSALLLATAVALGATACQTTSNQNNSLYPTHSRTDINYDEHSPLMEYLMENPEYHDILGHGRTNTTLHSHPFAFLKSKGHNVDAIKNGDSVCKTFSFIPDDEPNNLYIATCVADPTNTYYTEYMLRYKLSDKEMEDYTSMFHEFKDGFYNEAVFLNDAVSALHLGKEEVLSCANMGIKGNENLNSSMSKNKHKDLTGYSNNITILAGFDCNNNTFDFYVLPNVYFRKTEKTAKDYGSISHVYCHHCGNTVILSTADVFAIGDADGKRINFNSYFEIIPGSEIQTKQATFYITDGAELVDHFYAENENY